MESPTRHLQSSGFSTSHPNLKKPGESDPKHCNFPPPSFWDSLSSVPLCPRALREFDRRTEPLIGPAPPYLATLKIEHFYRLKEYAKLGGPDLIALRGYPNPIDTSGPMTRPQASRDLLNPSDDVNTSKAISPYDPAFEQHLIDHGVYPDEYEHNGAMVEPKNLAAIRARLSEPRPSLSPSNFTDEDFKHFRKTNRAAHSHSKVLSRAFPTITGHPEIPNEENIPFHNLAGLTDGKLTAAQPDFYDGSRPSSTNMRIREELRNYIEPSTINSRPFLPNFFAEIKGANGGLGVGKRQACYTGALGARGMHELRAYTDPKSAFDSNARTLTTTYDSSSGSLALYTTHVTPSKDFASGVEYHMTPLKGYSLTGDSDTFRQGATGLRNARDWAAEQRETELARALQKADGKEAEDCQDCRDGRSHCCSDGSKSGESLGFCYAKSNGG